MYIEDKGLFRVFSRKGPDGKTRHRLATWEDVAGKLTACGYAKTASQKLVYLKEAREALEALWLVQNFSWEGLSKYSWHGPFGVETLQEYWRRDVIDAGGQWRLSEVKRTDAELEAAGLLIKAPSPDSLRSDQCLWHIAHVANSSDAVRARRGEEITKRLRAGRDEVAFETEEELRARQDELNALAKAAGPAKSTRASSLARRITSFATEDTDVGVYDHRVYDTPLAKELRRRDRERNRQWPSVLRATPAIVIAPDCRAQLQGTRFDLSVLDAFADRQLGVNLFMARISGRASSKVNFGTQSDLSLAVFDSVDLAELTWVSEIHAHKTAWLGSTHLRAGKINVRFVDSIWAGTLEAQNVTLSSAFVNCAAIQTWEISGELGPGFFLNGCRFFGKTRWRVDCHAINGIADTIFFDAFDGEGSKFLKTLRLNAGTFLKDFTLDDATLSAGVHATFCKFDGPVRLNWSDPFVAATAAEAQIADLIVSGCDVNSDFQLRNRSIKGKCDFGETVWQRPPDFNGAVLPPDTSFRNATFKSGGKAVALNRAFAFLSGLAAICIGVVLGQDGFSLLDFALIGAVAFLPALIGALALFLSDLFIPFQIVIAFSLIGFIVGGSVLVSLAVPSAIAALFGATWHELPFAVWDDLLIWGAAIGAGLGALFAAFFYFFGPEGYQATNLISGMMRRAHLGSLNRAESSPWRGMLQERDSQRYQDATRFRWLKQAMATAGAKHEEARFFRLELRARRARIRLVSGEVSLIEKVFGYVYGTLSNYGESMLQPILSLVVSVFVFAAVYFHWGAGADLGQQARWAASFVTREIQEVQPDPSFIDATAYSMSRVFPIRPWTEKDTVSGVCGFADFLHIQAAEKTLCIPEFARGWTETDLAIHRFVVALTATFQSIFAGVLAFLFALAVRRRFQIS